jgi:hypothetical protein
MGPAFEPSANANNNKRRKPMSAFVQAIPEIKVEGKRLGRHILHDEASKEFKAEEAAKVQDVAHTTHGLPLSQTRGSCTAEAECGCLDTDPNFNKSRVPFTQKDADNLYDQEIVAEGGDPATDDPGGTGLMICKVAKKDGLISSYTHTFSLTSALKALVIRPGMTGVNWYEGFDEPDHNGLIKIAGQVRGGHEFTVVQVLAEQQLVGCVQSWDKWGVANKTVGLATGCFFMSFDTWDRLLGEKGDVTFPVV